MIKLIMVFMLLSPLSSYAKSFKYSKVVTVHGMVCAFCSNSLEKKFKKEKAVKKTHVDLKSKTVSVKFRKGKSLEDEKLKSLIEESGFKVVEVKNYEQYDKK